MALSEQVAYHLMQHSYQTPVRLQANRSSHLKLVGMSPQTVIEMFRVQCHSFKFALMGVIYYVSFSDLRLDSLSQILTLSNVRAHCRIMVAESCQGMMAGALLERMGGK